MSSSKPTTAISGYRHEACGGQLARRDRGRYVCASCHAVVEVGEYRGLRDGARWLIPGEGWVTPPSPRAFEKYGGGIK